MTNKIYVNPETEIVFADSAQSPDVVITLSALAAAAGRVSAQHDRGAGAKAALYEWRGRFHMDTTSVVGEEIEMYIATSGTLGVDGEEGIGDAALGSSNSLANMHYMGSVVVDTTVADTDLSKSGHVWIPARYINLVVFNNTVDALETNTGVHHVGLTPVPHEVQDAP